MKKRLLSLVLCLVMVFSLFPAFGMSAAAAEEDGFEYQEATPANGSTWTNSDDYTTRTLYYYDTETGKYWPVSPHEGTIFYPTSYSVKAGGSFTGNTYYYYDSDSDDYYPVKAGYGALFSPFDNYLKIYGNFSEDDEWQISGHYGRVGFNEDGDKFIYYYGTDGEMHLVYYNVTGHGGGFINGYYGITLWVYTDIANEPTVKEKTTGLFNSHDYYYIEEINSSNKFSTALSSGTITRIKNGTEGYGFDEYYYWQYLGATTHAGTDTAYYRDTLYYYTSDGLNELYYTDGNNQNQSISYMPIKDNYIVQNKTLYRTMTGVNSLGYTDDTGWHELGSTKHQTNGTVYTGPLYVKNVFVDPDPTGGTTTDDDSTILNPGGVSNAGFKLQKELSKNQQGSYDIKMQSYSTANTTTQTVVEKVPTDFIVVVDQSGSMAYRDMATGDYRDAGSLTLEQIAQQGTEEKDKTPYYIQDGENYYRVYAVNDYLMEYHESESKWTKNIIEEAGYSLSWFQGKDEASFSQDNQYYYKTPDGVYRPIHVTATGKIGTYYIQFYYEDANGKKVDFVRPTKPVYKNVFGSAFGKYKSGSLGYNAVNAAVLAAYPTTTAYTYSTFLGVTTGMYINYPMYTRHVGYSQLAYRDINGIEHIIKSDGGVATAQYCDSNGNALTSETGDRMTYSSLLTAGEKQTRIEALKAALTQFVEAVAAETDTRNDPNTPEAVDNRIAIVGFADPNSHNTELLTQTNRDIKNSIWNSGTDGWQKSTADSSPADYYGNALVAATDGESYGKDHVNKKLTDAIAAITANGGTQPEDGFDMARQILIERSGKQHEMVNGTTKDRNKIVIFFTDGRPGDYKWSNQYEEANQVVDAAKDVKLLGAKVFSIGVFGESDGNPLTYDAKNDKTRDPYNSDNEIRVKDLDTESWKYLGGWMETYKSGFTSYCLRRQWRPNNAVGYTATANDTIYDYMSVVSSNYPDAKYFIADDWINPDKTFDGNYIAATDGDTVRHKSSSLATNQFYRMAANQATLTKAFLQSVSYASTQQMSTDVVSLNSTAIFRDAINTKDFDVSNATYSVTWEPIKVDPTAVSATHPSAIVEDPNGVTKTPVVNEPVPANGIIEYSGFDYGANYVSMAKKTGYRLVVTVHGIVPTTYNKTILSNADPDHENGPYACGIYDQGSDIPKFSVKSPELTVELRESATTEVVGSKDIQKTPNVNDGSYTITLDAYAKGNSKQQGSTTETTGADIVIVVDKSGTMTTVNQQTGKSRFDDALAAISDFVDSANSTGGDHRIAVVKAGHSDSGDKQPTVYDGDTAIKYSDIKNGTNNGAAGFSDNAFKSIKSDTLVTDIQKALNAMQESQVYVQETFDTVTKLLQDRDSTSGSRKTIVMYLSDGWNTGNDDQTVFNNYVVPVKNAADVFAVRIDETSSTTARINFMKALSSSYPNATLSNLGEEETSIDYYQEMTSTSATSFDEVFDEVAEAIDYNINLDKDAYLLDVINMDNLALRDDLSQPQVKVYTMVGTYNENSANSDKIDWTNNKVDITNKVNVTFPTITDPETGKTSLGVKVTGFDYSANFIGPSKAKNIQEGTDAKQGKKIIVEISGLVPVHPGNGQQSNVYAGVYDKDDDLAKEFNKPTFDVASTSNSKTFVIDFSAPMILANNATTVTKMSGDNGEFSLIKANETDTTGNIVYQFKQSVEGSSFILNGVDQAFAYGIPVNSGMTSADWCTLTTIPAGSVYFDDDFTATTTMQPKLDGEGNPVVDDDGNTVYEPVTEFKQPINVGDGSGYNASVSASPASTNTAKGQYTFTFYGTGIDIYCTTDPNGGYVQAKCEGQTQTIKNYDATVTRYNVPSISFTGLTAGQHTVTLNVLNSSNYKLDGIRVYNPVSNETYEGQGTHEQYAAYINMREALVNDKGVSQAFTDNMDNAVLGALFVDDSSKLKLQRQQYDSQTGEPILDEKGDPVLGWEYETLFDAYKANSPKHEIYLDNGDAIVFQLSADAATAAANGNLWIGLSAPDAVKNDQGVVTTNTANGEVTIGTKPKTVTSGVDMYYPITSDMIGANRVVTLTNAGDNMISVTNLKITGNEDIYNAANGSKGQTASVNEPLASVQSVEDVIPMVFEPMTMRSVKIAANNGVDPDAVVPETPAPTAEPEVTPEPTPDPTPAPTETPAPVVTPTPTQAPSVHDVVKQIVSSFMSNLFRSISRLFGN